MSKSAIDTLRGRLVQYPHEWVFRPWTDFRDGKGDRLPLADVLREVDAIIVERDALKARLTPPPRKLREVKGVTYDVDSGEWRCEGWRCRSVATLITTIPHTLSDADHAAIYALKDDPYLPVETVESVIEKALTKAYYAGECKYGDWEGTEKLSKVVAEQVRSAVHAEGA